VVKDLDVAAVSILFSFSYKPPPPESRVEPFSTARLEKEKGPGSDSYVQEKSFSPMRDASPSSSFGTVP